MAEAAWEKLLPKYRGRLPGGGEFSRTEPGGSPSARIAILGLYPTETQARVVQLGREKLRLPAAVEARSFEGSAAGEELRSQVMAPLGLGDDQVYLLLAYPYYLSSDAARGDQSNWGDLKQWRERSGETDDVLKRPEPAVMADACRALPGNLERLTTQLELCKPTLLFTLGAEVAAFARGCSLAEGQRALYAPVERRAIFGMTLDLVHLAQPGILTSPLGAGWRAKHEKWSTGEGAALVKRHRI